MTDVCPAWRGDLAMMAVGRLEPDRRAAVQAHLDGCATCRGVLNELRSTARTLSFDLEDSWRHVPAGRDPVAPPRIVDAALAQVRQEVAGRRRRRIRLMAATVAAGLALFFGGVLTGHQTSVSTTDDAAQQVTLATVADGGTGAEVSAALTPRPWGTKVTLTATGLAPGQQVAVWLVDKNGKRVPCGTFTPPSGRTATVDLASAMAYPDAARIGVSTTDGEMLATGALL